MNEKRERYYYPTTPYATDEEGAKDYVLDKAEREKDIMDSEEIKHRKRMLKHLTKRHRIITPREALRKKARQLRDRQK